ncbi:MAG: hypothetical protein MIO88_04660, partial [Methanoregulaceae archaeon]|nr:hypothetical protein [Methanoregulaceae archaeon]
VHELRVDYGPGYRIYFGQEGARLILLMLGGDKSSQKKDIVRAKELWRDHRSGHNGLTPVSSTFC